MSKRSITATADETPITQADIDAGRLVLTKRDGGRITAKRRVNIYLDAAIVEHFKKQAGARGYQTLINQTLKDAIDRSGIETTLRKVIREELKGRKQAA